MEVAAALQIIESKASEADKIELARLLNDMILHRFDLLIALLYKVDVPEQEVKRLLRQQPSLDAGMLLAELLLHRQQEKEMVRKKPASDTGTIAEEDRW